MITKPNEFLDTHFEELEYLVEQNQWEDADVLLNHLKDYFELFDQEMLDKYYNLEYNITIGLEFE
jgi:hypothetical protein